jgi:hypothetical protein
MSAEQAAASAGDQEHPSPHRGQASLLALWTGLALAPFAWFVQLALETPLLSQACYPRDQPYAGALTGLAATLMAIDVATLLFTVVGFLVALRSWRHTAAEKAGRGKTLLSSGDGRSRFMAMSGMLVSALIGFAVLYVALSHALLPECGL